jgi:LysR family glycine cleavage system transcriptional activator
LDLKAGEVDVAIRYARDAPPDLTSTEVVRDTFYVVASPALIGSRSGQMTPEEIAEYPLIQSEWPPLDAAAPTWLRWENAARERHSLVPPLASLVKMSFREELHAIEAIASGQGIGICSDLLTRRELHNRTLVRVSDITLPGYGFYVVHRPDHPKAASIRAFLNWVRETAGGP